MSSQPRPLLRNDATSGSTRSSRASSTGGLRRLPLITMLFLAIVLLAWNLSYYQGLYIDHASAAFRREQMEAGSRGGAIASRAIDSPRTERARATALDRAANSMVRADTDKPLLRMGDAPDRIAAGVGAGAAEPVQEALVEQVRLVYPDDPDQVRVEGQRVDGQREGEWTEYYDDGTKKSVGSFVGDLREGPWVEYYPSGKPKSDGTYRAGLRDGSWRSWHETGGVMSEGVYREARRVETWTQYYTSGSVMESGRYIDGLREGFWAFYTADGSSDERTGWYEAGRLQDR